jgi:hypothetical protein
MKRINLLLHGLIVTCLLTSCLKAKTVPVNAGECPTVISYSLEIEPIIHSSCMTNQGPGTGCHDNWITEYDNIKNYLDAGIMQNQVIVTRIMPQIPNDFGIDSLSTDEYLTLKCWFDQGYPEN